MQNDSNAQAVLPALAAAIIATWSCITYLYPVVLDTWAFYYRDFDIETALQLQWIRYNNSNPRIGEFALIMGSGSYIGRMAANLIGILCMTVGLFALWHRRLPRLRSPEDYGSFLVFLAVFVALSAQPGIVLFYLPHNANYVLGFGLAAIFLAVFTYLTAAGKRNSAWSLLIVPLGLLAGLANEHVPPAVLGLLALLIVALWFHGRARAWQVWGWAAYLTGFLALIFAPGQAKRYGGRAEEQSLLSVDVILDRSQRAVESLIANPLAVVLALIIICAAILVRIRRPSTITLKTDINLLLLILALAAAVGFAVTCIASPIIAPRLMVASHASIAFAVMGAVHVLGSRWDLAARWSPVAAGAFLVYFSAQAFVETVPRGFEYRQRVAIAETQKEAGCNALSLPAYSWRGDTAIIKAEGSSEDPAYWLNVSMARGFDVDTVSVTRDGLAPSCDP